MIGVYKKKTAPDPGKRLKSCLEVYVGVVDPDNDNVQLTAILPTAPAPPGVPKPPASAVPAAA